MAHGQGEKDHWNTVPLAESFEWGFIEGGVGYDDGYFRQREFRMIMETVLHFEFVPNLYCSADERLFPEMEDEDIAERDRAAAALQSLVDSVKDIRTSDDPLLRAIKNLNKTYRGTRISLDNIFSWYLCNDRRLTDSCHNSLLYSSTLWSTLSEVVGNKIRFAVCFEQGFGCTLAIYLLHIASAFYHKTCIFIEAQMWK